jgi:RNA polymerase sigma-70 factor (ECF subfamily)
MNGRADGCERARPTDAGDRQRATVAVPQLVDDLFRRQAAQMVASLTRALGPRQLALAEELVQDALVTALQQWPYRGVPHDPAAWLFRVARNRALDRLRHERIVDEKMPTLLAALSRVEHPPAPARLSSETPAMEDDQLGMMFLTCHPMLPQESRVALTLKLVGGFSVGEIARAFLAQESAIAQRLVRAKRALRDGDVAFGAPSADDVVARLESVLEAIYLMFSEGYAATSGDVLIRDDIAGEAIRLAALLARHTVTATPAAHALLALLLLHASRFEARIGDDDHLFLLRDQDRSRWDRTLISEGLRALERAATGAALTRYHFEAEIAAVHALAPRFEATDWARIVSCYDGLMALTGSPVVALNRAVARSQVLGPRAAIAEIEAIAADLSAYRALPAILGELWREAGDIERAAAYYRDAVRVATSRPERRFLSSRLDRL